jgi:tellurite resistance protein TerC
MPTTLFPFEHYWWFYLAFTAAIVALLVFDLRLHSNNQAMPIRKAAMWTGVWIALAVAFSGFLYLFSAGRFGASVGRQVTLEFLAGYTVEESLSIDNMFVFAVIFRYFGIPSRFQHRVLFYGVLGAIVFRGLFIAAGSALVRYHWVLVGFGVFLIYTGLRMLFEKDREVKPEANPALRLVRRFAPVTNEIHGERFIIHKDGKRWLTPMFVALLALETSDIVFAVDSVPAVFGVTREPLLAYTSNIFAVLGLRSIYFLLAGAIDRFKMLQYGIALVLVFVGLKMVALEGMGAGASLAIIVSIIGGSMILSVWRPNPRVAAGSAFLALGAGSGLLATGILNWNPIQPEWSAVSGLAWSALGYATLRRR